VLNGASPQQLPELAANETGHTGRNVPKLFCDAPSLIQLFKEAAYHLK